MPRLVVSEVPAEYRHAFDRLLPVAIELAPAGPFNRDWLLKRLRNGGERTVPKEIERPLVAAVRAAKSGRQVAV